MFRHVALLALTAAVACSASRSTDPPAAGGSIAPRLSRFGDRIVLSWVEPGAAGGTALRFAARQDRSWGPAKTAVRDARLTTDAADIPAVSPLHGGGLAAHWTLKPDGSSQGRDLMVSVSRDGGDSWTAPTRPHRDGTDTEHGMAMILPSDTEGAFGLCWLDGRAGARSEYGEGGTSLYWADWSGDGFGPEVLLDARVCDCCKTSATRGPAGPIVAYRDREEAERRDIAIVRRDGGVWSAPRPVRADGWSISACPTNGPSVASSGDRVAVAWFTGANAAPTVWAALSADGGKTLGPAVRVDSGAPVGRVETAMLPDGSAAIVWLERNKDGADVRVRRIDPGGGLATPVTVATTSPARASGTPSIAAVGAREVLVAWTEAGPPGRLRAATVTLP